jgi:uncharacterized protein YndB with AHSA1/START domain
MPTSGTVTVTFPAGEDILITREFTAPRHLVYRAWTTPALVERWWSGGRGRVTSIEIDLRAGGAWRYRMAADDGSDAEFHGEFREVVPGERLVYTEVWSGRPTAEALTTVTFRDTGDGRTTVAILMHHGSEQDRDVHRGYLADGLQDALDRLEQTASAGQPGLAGQ